MIFKEKHYLQKKIRRTFKKFKVNKKYKDRLFRFLFKNKKDLLELYNAINHTTYDNADDLTITTLENAIYITMKNDLSFAFAWTMNLYEHQSTANSNMPIRGVSYFARIYEDYIKENGLNVYGKSKIKLPLPQFVVFYNGTDDEPSEIELRLSDLFVQEVPNTKPALECIAKVININHKDNTPLINQCQRLREYVYFTKEVNNYLKKGYELEDAIELSISKCLQHGIMTDVLAKFRNEVYRMFLFEYDEELHMKNAYEEGRADGLSIGREEGLSIGREEGRTEERALLLIQLLKSKGNVPDNIKDKILSENNPDRLKEWFDIALNVNTIDEFLDKI